MFWIAAVATTADGACIGGWRSRFGYEYCIDSDEVTHATARSTCHSKNSELASITSSAECDYVYNLMLVKLYVTMSLTL